MENKGVVSRKRRVSVPFQVDAGGQSVRARKAELRHEMLARRRVIPGDLKDTTQWKVINHLRSVLGSAPGVVALYYARGSEIDLYPLAVELWRAGQTVCLPRVVERGHPLVFSIWEPDARTEPDALGLPTGCGPAIWPSAMVIPMLGYTRTGYRLGYGGGYYDRTLKAAPFPALTVGVCYTELEVTDFPAEYHDQRLMAVVTGKEIIAC